MRDDKYLALVILNAAKERIHNRRNSMITLEQYYMGRDKTYPADFTNEIQVNAAKTVAAVNSFINVLAQNGITPEVNHATGSQVSSGWRPPAINANTPNAALRSNHMRALACDVYDPEGEIDDWCMNNLAQLEALGLWLEHPSSTKGWSHVQIVPPKSGNRVFYP